MSLLKYVFYVLFIENFVIFAKYGFSRRSPEDMVPVLSKSDFSICRDLNCNCSFLCWPTGLRKGYF